MSSDQEQPHHHGELVVVTGMTGAGRSTAAKELEDLGYYVVDNMPPSLLREVVRLVHGQDALDAALKASEILFGAEIGDTSEEVFRDVVGEIPTQMVTAAQLTAPGWILTEALVHAGLSQSKGQARKDIEGGGVYINNVKCGDIARALTTTDLLFGKHVLVRKGKRTYAVLNLAD